MDRTRRQSGGWTAIEALATIMILGMLLGGLGIAQWRMGEFNAVQHARRQCVAAAQAQIESLAARGKGMDGSDARRLWPGVSVAVEQSPGGGQWQGLTLVRATGSTEAKGRPVRVSLARYLPAERAQP